MPFLDSHDGTTLFYRDRGTGRPIVFCSAWGLDSTEFQYQTTDLVENGFRVISYDRRSHGRSDDPGHGYDYDTLADDLSAVLTHLDLYDASLVGHSMGTGEIVRYLTRHSTARTRRLVLIGPVLPFMLATPDNPSGVPAAAVEEIRTSWKQDFGTWLHENAPAYFGETLPNRIVSQHVQAWTLSSMMSVPLHAMLACNHSIIETDFRPELPAITLPTLIIHGDMDASVAAEISAEPLSELLPNASLKIYENAPHGLYLTHAARLAQDLLDFTRESARHTAEDSNRNSPGTPIHAPSRDPLR
ncbi:alpha/beta fold hydrolase [Nocardia sp. SYP-A9097]|uniref:alpha/beta fold hydrolase n=1 Tax=Nocardia sp. SYP-A9097 TaxID=2663237 RepID=UPI001891B8E7|nr:alpha/beta hydrolase [Nocardia sp. SYP-A9097]